MHMNTERMKTIVLTVFVGLNIVLFALNLNQGQRYVLTQERIDVLETLLENNHITLSSELMLTYMPKQNVSMQLIEIDPTDMIGLFFDTDAYDEKEDFDQKIYAEGNKFLVWQEGQWYFSNDAPKEANKFDFNDEKSVISYTDLYVKALKEKYKTIDLYVDHVYKTDDFWQIDYRSKYNQDVVYSNFFRFTVSLEGIVDARFQYAIIEGVTDEKRNIYAADEALLTFIYEVKKIFGDTADIEIVDMDLVTFVPSKELNSLRLSKGEHFYRIYIKDQLEPFLINAHTNSVYY